ncbi:MAG: hypothetical protein FJ386_05860 [Verrucomicrobia bacterium]|nr:hypothetical protein [Verrucomicrobiota bacterium]
MKHSKTPRNLPSARELRELQVEIDFFEGLAVADPGNPDVLRALGDNYTRAGRHADSLRVDVTLARLLPDDSMIHYNLACSYALTSQIERAIETLQRSMDLGFRDFEWIDSDPDLTPLRNHPLFGAVRAKIRALQRCRH